MTCRELAQGFTGAQTPTTPSAKEKLSLGEMNCISLTRDVSEGNERNTKKINPARIDAPEFCSFLHWLNPPGLGELHLPLLAQYLDEAATVLLNTTFSNPQLLFTFIIMDGSHD